MESIIETRIQQAAERLGVSADRVQVQRLEISQMREAGLLIDLDVHGTSMFSAKVTNAELGISADDVRSKRLRAGSKDLFPKHARKFRSLETRARQNLVAHTFKVSVFGGWYWMPWTAYESFQEKHQQILDELEAVKADCLAHYNEVREQNRAYFEQVGDRAWKALLSGYAPGDTVVIRTTSGATFEAPKDYNRFIEYVVQKALSKMPLPEEIESGVRIDYRTSILYSESEVEAEVAAVAKAEAELAKAKAEQEKANLELWTAEQEARAKVEAFRRAEIEHARQQLAEMSSPITEAMDALKASIHQAVADLLSGLQRNGGFRGRASAKAAELLQTWRQLNGGLLQDEQLEQALIDLDAKMKAYQAAKPTARDGHIGDITSQLTVIAAQTVEAARKLRRSGPTRASALEL